MPRRFTHLLSLAGGDHHGSRDRQPRGSGVEVLRASSSEPRWSLLAARLVGVWAVGVLAQAIVDMPDGYLGAADRMTPPGIAYAAVSTLAAAILVAALLRRRSWAMAFVPLVLSLNVGAFLPPIASDPLVAGTVVLWNLTLLAAHFLPSGGPSPVVRRLDPHQARLQPLRGWPAVRHLTIVSLVLTLAVVGYRLSDSRLAWTVCLALAAITLLAAFPLLRELHRRGRRAPLLVALPIVASLLAAAVSTTAVLALLALAEIFVLAVLLGQLATTQEILQDFYDHPSRLVVGSFAALALAGTLLLSLPEAAPEGQRLGTIDALFTATSAVCVTGLIVLDTPHDFSLFGQIVILGLIQVGGLGIMVLSTFAAVLLGGGLGMRGERALTEMLELRSIAGAYRLTRFIVVGTLAVEAAGAVALGLLFAAAGSPPARAAWEGVFHSVSAFCNAGFSLQSDSLLRFQEHPLVIAVVAALIVLGGLGFIVLATLWTRLGRRERGPVSIQARVVLAVSATLLLVGAFAYGVLEWNRSLAELPLFDKLTNALFQSVTLRTAGFNTVDLSALAPATILLMLLFMFVGASPGSTGGGIKTTTAAVLLAAIRAAPRPRSQVTLFDREVPWEIVNRSLAITVVSITLVAIGLFLLLVFESQPFLDLAFETMSAFGTVGLSLGATPELGPGGRLVVVALMFAGRVGPLTLALLLGTSRRATRPFHRPQTRIMVG